MNARAIEPTSAAPATQSAASATPPKKAPPPRPAEAPAPATPATTVALSAVPATVQADDRALYLQILKSVGGNVGAALAALAALKAKEASGG